MNRQKVGLILFWIGVIWAVSWGLLGSINRIEFFARVLTFEQFNQTIWTTNGILYLFYGFAPLLGAAVAGIGLLLRSGANKSTVWKFGIGIVLVIMVNIVIGALGHFPPLYAIGGSLILLFFFGLLWFWAKERLVLEGHSATAADLKLAGYVFMFIAVWFTCGISDSHWNKAFADQPPSVGGSDPIVVQIYFVLGWLFLSLGYYKSSKH